MQLRHLTHLEPSRQMQLRPLNHACATNQGIKPSTYLSKGSRASSPQRVEQRLQVLKHVVNASRKGRKPSLYLKSLLKLEASILKSKFQKKKTVVATWESEPRGTKPKGMSNQRKSNSRHKICLRAKVKQKSWYLDSGCSRHMTGEKSMFLTLTMKEGGSVKFGGRQPSKIIGTGTIGNSSISINNVWLVDSL
ncbi:hypothetical protein MTR_2g450380 [Medicago truncatula]|uniref:Retrovirus-related Pol polyprotein from transposon TNT 1-94-like beta-barrel domain-containing protein n=1 Tax=Medicago truncatula TaxID=3880 RepID=A0A072V7W3_MEDTR|nr:hypothetical protein MTR_2g450380 [Medicago truncatula]